MALNQVSNQDALGNESVVVTGPIPLPTGAATADKQPALGTAGTSSPDVLTIQGAMGMTAVQVVEAAATVGTITSVPSSAITGTILASNINRKSFSVYNDSTTILYLAFAASASVTAFSVKLQPNSYYESNVNYTGAISGIWASVAGNARVTEFT